MTSFMRQSLKDLKNDQSFRNSMKQKNMRISNQKQGGVKQISALERLNQGMFSKNNLEPSSNLKQIPEGTEEDERRMSHLNVGEAEKMLLEES